VGVSSDLLKASGLPLRNLLNSKFSGKIYPVDPRSLRSAASLPTPLRYATIGSVFTEILKDYALGLVQLTADNAKDMLSSLKAFSMLEKSALLERLADALLRLSDSTPR
jgi:hypothetical protein